MKIKRYDNINIHYDYFDEKSDKLAIVFQGNNQSNILAKKMINGDHKMKDWMNVQFEVHSKYSFYDTFKDSGYNILMLPDLNSDIVSWYVVDKGMDITKAIATFIDEFIEEQGYKKENVLMIGQSKGGFASLYYANQVNNVGKVLCSLPILHPGIRFSTNRGNKVSDIQLDAMRGDMTREELILYFNAKSFSIDFDPEKEYKFHLGISDEFTYDILKLFKDTNADIYVDKKIDTHDGYAKKSKNSLKKLIKEFK